MTTSQQAIEALRQKIESFERMGYKASAESLRRKLQRLEAGENVRDEEPARPRAGSDVDTEDK